MLTTKDGSVRPVQPEVMTVELVGQQGVEDEAVARVSLAISGVPAGEYVIDYFCFRPQSSPVRVENGVFLSTAAHNPKKKSRKP